MTVQDTQATGLRIPATVLAELRQVAQREAPNEACGLLGGANGCVIRFYPLTNADASPEHFSMIPAEQFAAIKDMRAEGLRILAVWHSHPNTPARMSEEDMRLAYMPGVAYAILSLAVPEPDALKAFEVIDETPKLVTLVITGDRGA